MKSKVLFFINGSLPSESDLKKSEQINGKVCFRNASMVSDDHKPEDCDYVAGEVPEAYSEFDYWDFEETEIKVPSNPIKPAPKTPAIKSEPKTAVAGWKPNS